MAEPNTERAIPEKGGDGARNLNFHVAEAYKMIRTNLLFTLANTDSHVVVFSSAEPSAGKSTLCSNLAIVMAQTGARVLLIDADMRKPVQHRNFRRSKTYGLSRILGGLNSVEECIQQNVLPNLDLITSGPLPPNPSELLGTERMKTLLGEMASRYDYVFLDMPPMCVVADALVVAPYSAGVVLVARQRQTTYGEVQECLERVEQIGAKTLGVVITDVNIDNVGYYARFGHYGRYTRYGRYGKRYYYRKEGYRYAARETERPSDHD